jgi:predicted membrane protein
MLRTATLICTALVVGLAFAHVLELPQKMSYGADEYARVQHSLYAYFAYVGGPLEVLSIVLAAVLAMMLRHDRAAFGWSAAGTGLLAAGLAEWAVVVQTANGRMADWAVGNVPAGWTAVRAQWEFGHLAHFALLGSGFTVLLWSSLKATPAVRANAG